MSKELDQTKKNTSFRKEGGDRGGKGGERGAGYPKE